MLRALHLRVSKPKSDEIRPDGVHPIRGLVAERARGIPPPLPVRAQISRARFPAPAQRKGQRRQEDWSEKIQSALSWSGDYTGSLGGEDPFLSAIKNYQKRARSKITGVLTPAERANLLAAAKTHEEEYGWTVVVDPATGVRIGLPIKMVPQVRDAARGTRWSSAHGEVQVETFRVKDSDLKLSALFDQLKSSTPC